MEKIKEPILYDNFFKILPSIAIISLIFSHICLYPQLITANPNPANINWLIVDIGNSAFNFGVPLFLMLVGSFLKTNLRIREFYFSADSFHVVTFCSLIFHSDEWKHW